jgi:hypothetical protein
MASLDDVLTTLKNIVTAQNNQPQTALQIAGQKNATGLTAQTVVSANPGRVATIAVIVAGSAVGSVYDASTTATATSSRLLAAIPNTVGIIVVNMPVVYGIVVTPGTGMTIAVSYS